MVSAAEALGHTAVIQCLPEIGAGVLTAVVGVKGSATSEADSSGFECMDAQFLTYIIVHAQGEIFPLKQSMIGKIYNLPSAR